MRKLRPGEVTWVSISPELASDGDRSGQIPAEFRLFYLTLSLLVPCHKGKSTCKGVVVCTVSGSHEFVVEIKGRNIVIVSDGPQFEFWLWDWVVVANFLCNLYKYIFSSLQLRMGLTLYILLSAVRMRDDAYKPLAHRVGSQKMEALNLDII